MGPLVDIRDLKVEATTDAGRRVEIIRGVSFAIAPGEIETSILSPGTEALVAAEVPMGRLGEPREVAETIYFLCTEQSSYINGAEIHINGGQHV